MSSNLFKAKLDNLDIELEYFRAGNGRKILFLHGALGSSRFYHKSLVMLAKYYDTIAPSLPGMGRSDSLGKITSYKAYVEALLEFTSGNEYEAIVGHSLGGAVATGLALARPSLGKKIVLIDSAGIPYDNFFWDTVKGWYRGYKEYFANVHPKGINILPWDIRNMVFRRPLESIRIARVLGKLNLTNQFPKISQKVDILWGEDDSHIPLRKGREIASLIAGSTLSVIPGVDHNWIAYQVTPLLNILD